MTLIELLVRDLKAWPKYARCIAQNSTGCVWAFAGFPRESKGFWTGPLAGLVPVFPYTVKPCEDSAGELVTESQWLREVAHLATIDELRAEVERLEGLTSSTNHVVELH